MESFFSYLKGQRYTAVSTLEEAKEPLRNSKDSNSNDSFDSVPQPSKPRGWSTTCLCLLLLTTLTLSGTIGFYAGLSKTNSPQTVAELLQPVGTIKAPWIYNRTFTYAPAPDSNKAWDDLFPKGVGFVKHPTISPKLSGLAVFHELHCVNMLRIGYYAALAGTLPELQHVHDHNRRPDPHHLRHCFDYLRQALMCAADTNLEPVDFDLGGVTGWRFEKTCRNFEAVKGWAEEWRSWDEGVADANANGDVVGGGAVE